MALTTFKQTKIHLKAHILTHANYLLLIAREEYLTLDLKTTSRTFETTIESRYNK